MARGCGHARSLSLLALVAAIGGGLPVHAFASTFIVNTTGDPGPMGTLSLRQAIAAASASTGNTVQIAATLAGSTITVSSGQIAIGKSMTIAGPGADVMTISASNASRIFYMRPVPDDADPTHTQVTISGVTLTQGNSGALSGGAIFAEHTQLALSRVTVSASKGGAFGGGIYSLLGKTTIEHSRLVGNQSGLYGGGLHSASDLSVRVYFSTISGNTAGAHGAGLFIQGTGDALIGGSTISGNSILQPDQETGTQGGGGVAFSGLILNAGAEIVDSTITQNYSPTGGAGVAMLDALSGTAANFYFSTIAGNTSAPYETGIGITSAGGTAYLHNSIAANNFSQSGNDDLAGSFKVKQSLVMSPGGATITGTLSVIGADPQLGPLVDNGGETLTMVPAAGSPAVHAVVCSPCADFPVIDQRGAPRHYSSDMGAVERQYPEDLIFRTGFSPP
ncbi:MAG TPA: choice-of-anchor Q domain-containing protein [Rudaea sp.]|nr:choice-of-anchor Q domain-containing protein [Rudaea sp.]HSC11483.1 choice-of-anchor Q domain-containing protein [Rhodanobacteraceae bacterium]